MDKDKNNYESIIYLFYIFYMGCGLIILKLIYVYIRIREIDEVIADNESHVTEKVTNRERREC